MAYIPIYSVTLTGTSVGTPALLASYFFSNTFDRGTKIPEGADLDDYTKPGVYYFVGDNVSNAPSGVSTYFKLVVEYGATRNMIIQRVFDISTTNWEHILERTRWIYVSDSEKQSHYWACTSGVDSIIEEGASGGWYWVKYASGRARMWYRGFKSDYEPFYAQDNAYVGNLGTYNFPFQVTGSSIVTGCSNSYATIPSTPSGIDSTKVTVLSFALRPFTTAVIGSILVMIQVEGWWK